eukprot:TRINITY_DN941_c0_g1_i2.p1 TRINITY_DN941_c0_g1~~TRINITY_DN941_c0_g1_i2.p1  ORF type:complete len:121 (-),score=6.06 TRINITY_DN941_c0_g1_i2:765-1127(-)
MSLKVIRQNTLPRNISFSLFSKPPCFRCFNYLLSATVSLFFLGVFFGFSGFWRFRCAICACRVNKMKSQHEIHMYTEALCENLQSQMDAISKSLLLMDAITKCRRIIIESTQNHLSDVSQ